MTTSASASRTDASSLARNSVSDWVRAATSRSRSMLARSRSSWRFWASRISGAAYAAWVEKARLSRMNGYGSQSWMNPMAFSAIQTTMNTDCPARNRPVPMNRAMASANLPNASAS